MKEDEQGLKPVAGIRYEKADVLFYKWVYTNVVGSLKRFAIRSIYLNRIGKILVFEQA